MQQPAWDIDNRIYRVGLALAVVICVAELVSLPVFITVDGYWYAKLAEVVGTPRFPSEWDYLRTPLFPVLLKVFFWLFGRQPLAVAALQTTLSFAGIWMLAATLRRIGRTLEAALVFPLLAAFPTLTTYEHSLLTEAGTFFFLSAILFVATSHFSSPARHIVAIIGVLGAAYYHRSSLLYMSPVIGLVYGWRRLSAEGGTPVIRSPQWRIAGEALLIVSVPFLIAYPWESNPRVSERMGDVLLYGLAKQAVLPPQDPIWAKAQQSYAAALDQSLKDGQLPLSGVKDQLVYAPLEGVHEYASSARSVFVRAVISYPQRYIAGCLRTALLFAEVWPSESDNAVFRTWVLSGTTVVAPQLPGFPPLAAEMTQQTKPSAFGRLLTWLVPTYDWLVCAGLLATLTLVIVGILRRSPTLLAFGLIPTAFLLLNVFLLVSQDRIAAPAYPLVLVNLIALPGVLARKTTVWS
jgi:hypothetical protein